MSASAATPRQPELDQVLAELRKSLPALEVMETHDPEHVVSVRNPTTGRSVYVRQVFHGEWDGYVGWRQMTLDGVANAVGFLAGRPRFFGDAHP